MSKVIKAWLLIVILMGVAVRSTAQGKGWIAGRLLDRQAQPIAFATVTVQELDTVSPVRYSHTDSSGRFVFRGLPFGIFGCKFSHTGYQVLTTDSIFLSPLNSSIDLGDLTMIPSDRLLAEATVSARLPTIHNAPDKKVFPVNQSLVSIGGSAADLLQNIPLLQLDANGNPSLRGAANGQVLVDGKRSLIGGGTIAQLLQSIPASTIDRVEIITNPSAKYDAEGQALINIVLKKNRLPGFNSSFAITAGTRDNYNAAGSIAYQRDRVNLYGNYSYQRQNTYSNGFQDMTYLAPSNPAYYSNETFPSVTVTTLHSGKAGVDYTLTAKDAISLTGIYNDASSTRDESLTVNNLTATRSPVELSTRHNGTVGHGNTYELTVDYTHKFGKSQNKLDFNFDYSHRLTDFLQVFKTSIGNLNGQTVDSSSAIKDSKLGQSWNYNFQMDYTALIGKSGKLETGYRSQIGIADNRQWDYNLDQSNGEFKPDNSLINFFKSTNQVLAAYITYRRQLKTIGFELGIRAELGRFNAGLQSFDSSGNLVAMPITAKTKGLYPNLLLTKQLGNGRQIRLSYTRRINRPTPRELNPFVDVSDPVNYDAGNPKLLPEDIHSFELTYSYSMSNGSLTSTAYLTQVNHAIKHIESVPANDIIITTSQNLDRAVNTGLELIGNFHLAKAWDFTINTNLYERINAAAPIYGISATKGFSWNANLTNNVTIGKSLTIQVRADYKAADVIIQDMNRPAYGIDAAARYDFAHGKASLAVNSRDIFNTRRWKFLRESDALLLDFQRITYSARASLTFAYHFGKSNIGDRFRKRPDPQQDTRIENR